MFRTVDPRNYEFVGYRMNITNAVDRLSSNQKYFGDGFPNDLVYANSYLKGLGNGKLQEFDLTFAYWALKILRSGDYFANHTFTVTY